MIDFAALFSSLGDKLIALLILTAIDFILGTILALVRKNFSWDKLTGYIESDILPIIAWVAVEMIASFPQNVLPPGAVSVVPVAVYGTVFLRILASVLGHVASMGVARGFLGKVGVDTGAG